MALVALAGCGSTVALNSAGAGGGGNLGGSSTGSAASATNAGGTGSGSGLSGTTVAGGGGSGGTGLAPGSPAASSGPSGAPGSSGGGAVGTGPGNNSGDGPGVTATTINVGVAYDPDASTADSALGAANANPGDQKVQQQAVIDYVNTHGGVAHRKLVPIWYQATVNNSATTTDSQACAAWTQDTKTFVFTIGGTPIFDQCTANAHAIADITGATALETTPTNEKYPADINLTALSIDRAMRVTVQGLAQQGYFSHGAKVGIATWDDPNYHYGIGAAAQPALAAVGLHNVPVEYIAVPQSYGDLSATSASVSSAVLKFHQQGIDHVLLFDGPAGVNSSGILVIEWTNQAQSQRYFPRYGLNSTSGLSTLAPDLPAQQLAGSLAVGWYPTLDETTADYPTSKLPPAGRLCQKIMAAAGQPASGNNQLSLELAECDSFFFLQQVLDPITGPLNQKTALAAIDAIGSRYTPLSTFGVYLSSTRHDGASLVSNAAFVASCTCYRYTGSPYNPG
ncbi:MAG TPA: hypothetical protein VNE21_03560 [Mycobacteriales bacterium]|nr:hypothetical protein [Mycobacteriales bacterium]